MIRSQYGERTISGLNKADFDEVNISKASGALTFDNYAGTPHQILQLDSSNEPGWKDITISPGSITGTELANNIAITTTGAISCGDLQINTTGTFQTENVGTGGIPRYFLSSNGDVIHFGSGLQVLTDAGIQTLLVDIHNNIRIGGDTSFRDSSGNTTHIFYRNSIPGSEILDLISTMFSVRYSPATSHRIFFVDPANSQVSINKDDGTSLVIINSVNGNISTTGSFSSLDASITGSIDCANLTTTGFVNTQDLISNTATASTSILSPLIKTTTIQEEAPGTNISIVSNVETDNHINSIAAAADGNNKIFKLQSQIGHMDIYGGRITLHSNTNPAVIKVDLDATTGNIANPTGNINTGSINTLTLSAVNSITTHDITINNNLNANHINITGTFTAPQVDATNLVRTPFLTNSNNPATHPAANANIYCILSITYAGEAESGRDWGINPFQMYNSGCFIPEQPFQLNEHFANSGVDENSVVETIVHDNSGLGPFGVAFDGGGTSNNDGFPLYPYLTFPLNSNLATGLSSITYYGKLLPDKDFFNNVCGFGYKGITGNNTNGGHQDPGLLGFWVVYLVWNDGSGTFTSKGNFHLPTQTTDTNGDYYMSLFTTNMYYIWTDVYVNLETTLTTQQLTNFRNANRFGLTILGQSNTLGSRVEVAGITDIGFFAHQYSKPTTNNTGWNLNAGEIGLNPFCQFNGNKYELLGNGAISGNNLKLDYINGYYYDYLPSGSVRKGDSGNLVEYTLTQAVSGDNLALNGTDALGMSSDGNVLIFDYKVPPGYRAIAYQVILTGDPHETTHPGEFFFYPSEESNLYNYCVIRGQGRNDPGAVNCNLNQIISVGTDHLGHPIPVLSAQSSGALPTDTFSYAPYNTEITLRTCKIGDSSSADTLLNEGVDWTIPTRDSTNQNVPVSNLTQDGMRKGNITGSFTALTGQGLYDPSYTPRSNANHNSSSSQISTLELVCINHHTFSHFRLKGAYFKLVKFEREWT